MGRALLLITLGTFVVLGIIQRAVNNRQFTMTEGNIETYMVNQGRNATGSGLDMAINRIVYNYDNNWESSFNSNNALWTFPIDEMNVEVFVDDENHPDVGPRFLRIRSEFQLENRRIQSIAFLERGSLNLPELDGALTVYSKNSNIRINGSPLKIVGQDTDYRTGQIIEDASHKPAISAPIENPEDWTSNSGWITINGQDRTVFTGEPDQFSYNPDLDGTEVRDLIDELMKPGVGTIYDGAGTMGTLENPQITVFDGSIKNLANNAQGAGILVIPPGVEIKMPGGLDFYGLIISAGQFDFGGNVNVYGGMMMSDEALFEFDADAPESVIFGTPTLYYSSEILEMIENRLGGGGSSTVVDRILY